MEINLIWIVIVEVKVIKKLKEWLFLNYRIQIYLIFYRDLLYLFNLYLYNHSQNIEKK